LDVEDLKGPEVYYPLKLFVCDRCFLVQIDEYKKAGEIFTKEYAYFSSYSTSWLAHSKRYVDMMIDRFNFNSGSQVIEVASNDGYLLQYFKERGIPVLGIEPTSNTAQVAIEKGIDTRIVFFGERTAYELVKEELKADLLLGNNVLAHVPDINDFVKGLKIVLAPSGVITMEFPHLLQLILQNQFDTIYHEHFSYLSFHTVEKIFKQNGLRLFDVEELPTHGGSLRIFACHNEDSSKQNTSNVDLLLRKENVAGMDKLDFYMNFQERVQRVKLAFCQFLIEQKAADKKVVGYGAAAKGNTLLNFCGIRRDLIEFVVDASPYKQGKFLPGSHIPVVHENEISRIKPDYVLILPWNIREEIVNQLSYIREWNGQFVTAIPELSIF
jgi:2-polyprenyl-3-methyl-5-hydroxy-6-metoxy-1,4-benzoquinol methylase